MWATAAPAQEVQRIAAVVNDEAVSMLDLIQRLKMVIFTSGITQSPEVMERLAPQVLRTLIDERIRLQEARSQNITVSEPEITAAIRSIETRNRIPKNSFRTYLESNNINPESAITQLRAEISWSKLVQRRGREALTVSNEDIDEELARLRASQGKPEYLMSEIFLIVERPDQDKTVRQNAERLVEQIRQGGDFVNLARQFSDDSTAGRGGNVGWTIGDQLPEEVYAAIITMENGQTSNPIRTGGGYLIVLLRDQRQMMAPSPDEAQVTIRQVLLALPEAPGPDDIAAQTDLARVIRETVTGCEDMTRAAQEIDPSVLSDLGTVRLKDLAPVMRNALSNVPAGGISEPVRTAQGIHLIMVCERIDPDSSMPNREEVRKSIAAERLDQVSRRYLRDLRRNAFVDIRI